MKNEKENPKLPGRGGSSVSLVNEIIKREKKFHSIYSTFTLNIKRCNKYFILSILILILILILL